MSAPLCFIDTETTGVHPGRQVWEVAMIRREGDQEQGIQFFVDVDLSAADPFGLKIGGFYDRHPVGRFLTLRTGAGSAPTAKDGGPFLDRPTAARVVAQYTHGAHLVGAVPNFDSETLDPLLRGQGYVPAWHYHLIDVENLAVGYILGRADGMGTPADLITAALPPWKSDELSVACGIAPPSEEERHTAMGDARWAMRWYDAIVHPSPGN